MCLACSGLSYSCLGLLGLSIPVTLTQYDEAKAYAVRAMLEAGMSRSQIHAKVKISDETISVIKKSEKFDPERVRVIKDGLAAKIYEKVDLALDSIDKDKLIKATAQQAMMTAAIGIDKARLIEGEVTQRVEFVNAADKDLAAEIAKLNEELARLERGEIVDAEVSTNQPESPATESDSQNPVLSDISAPTPALEIEANRVSPENNER